MPEQIAEPGDAIQKPHDWELVVSVAYLRMLGESQEVAAKGAGCSERSVATWEHCSWYVDAQIEARRRWLHGGDALAMKGLHKGLKDRNEYATMTRYWADRRIPEMTPPKSRTELSGPDDGPIEISDTRAELTRRITGITTRTKKAKVPRKPKR